MLFNAGTKSFGSTSGVLDVMSCPRGTTIDVQKSLIQAIDNFCTRDFCAPSLGPVGKLDRDLKEQLTKKLRGLFADGAKADQNAIEGLLERKDILPKLTETGRDKAHAARSSVTTRPLTVLSDSATSYSHMLVLGKGSAVRIIENSGVHKQIWADNAKVTGNTVQADAIGYAKQRYDNADNPYTKICLQPGRFFKTCSDIAFERLGAADGQHMANLLQVTSDEHLVMTGLLTMVFNTGLALIRKLDELRVESEKIVDALGEYEDEMEVLFGSNGAAYSYRRSEGMFINYIYEWLRVPRQLLFPSGSTIIGGRSVWMDEEMMSRCKQEMRSVCQAARACLKTEFPFWESCQQFKVFDVNPNTALSDTDIELPLKRLALKFNVSEPDLVAQFKKVRPLAIRRFAALHRSDAAWKAATSSVESRRGMKFEVLREIGCEWVTEMYSSSGCEHGFTHSARLCLPLRARASGAKRRDDFVLSYSKRSLEELAKPYDAHGRVAYKAGLWGIAAQEVWARLYPRARRRLVVRADAGVKRGARKDKFTYAAAVLKSRAAVRSAMVQARSKSKASPGQRLQPTLPKNASTRLEEELELQSCRFAAKNKAAAQ